MLDKDWSSVSTQCLRSYTTNNPTVQQIAETLDEPEQIQDFVKACKKFGIKFRDRTVERKTTPVENKTSGQACQAQALASIAKGWPNVLRGQFEIIVNAGSREGLGWIVKNAGRLCVLSQKHIRSSTCMG
jgi:hypothetical protein